MFVRKKKIIQEFGKGGKQGVTQVHYVSNYNAMNNPYSATFNPSWKNYRNMSWNNQIVMKAPLKFSTQENKSSLEELFQLANNTNQFMTETKTNFKNQSDAIRNLET